MKPGRPVSINYTIISVGVVQVFAFAILALALVYNQTALMALCLFSLIMVQGARLWTAMSGKRLHATFELDRSRIFPGEEVNFELSLENEKPLPILARAIVNLPIRPGSTQAGSTQAGSTLVGPTTATSTPVGALAQPELECGLSAYQRASRKFLMMPERRGCYEIDHIRVETGDLLGLFRCTVEIPNKTSLIVFPRIVPLNPVEFPALEFFGSTVVKAPVVDPAYYLGTRDYSGDRPARHIHWKASARQSVLQEKIFEPTAQRAVCLVVDARGFERAHAERMEQATGTAGTPDVPEAYERMLETAASLAGYFESNGASVAFISNAASTGGGPRMVKSGKGGRSLGTILEAMARLEMRSDCDLAEILDSGMRMTRASVAVYLGYDFGEGALTAWRILSAGLRLHLSFVLSDSLSALHEFSGCPICRMADLRYEDSSFYG